MIKIINRFTRKSRERKEILQKIAELKGQKESIDREIRALEYRLERL
jgi:hypothetical protein